MAADNVSLGRFILTGIPPAPRGVPQIEVTFNIDVNGILQVSAKDLATGKEQAITIKSTRLSEEEIERMRKEAELHAEEDKRRKELAEARNQADSLIYSTERTMRDFKDKITDAEREELNKAIGELRKVMSGEDINAIKKAMEDLTNKLHRVTSRLYQSGAGAQAGTGPQGGAAGPGGAQGGSGGEGKTMDAQFKEASGGSQ